jgi:hypothetical protein
MRNRCAAGARSIWTRRRVRARLTPIHRRVKCLNSQLASGALLRGDRHIPARDVAISSHGIAWHRMASHGIAWHRMALTGQVSLSRTWSLWATPLDGPRSQFVTVTSVGSRKPVVAYPWQQFSRLSWSISPCRPNGVHVHESLCGPWTHLRYAP